MFFAILIDAGMRAWREPIANNNGLQQWEFVLSKTEYEKFWLKKSQWNQIVTALKALEQERYIKYTGRKLGSEQSKIYQFLINDLFVPIWMSGIASGNEQQKSGTALGTNKENIEIEKKRESTAPSDSLSDECLIAFIELFKKATNDKVRVWTWKSASDVKYMRMILEDPKKSEILDKLCVEWWWPCGTIEDKITIFAKWLKNLLKDNKYWPKKLSSIKAISDSFWDIVNDF